MTSTAEVTASSEFHEALFRCSGNTDAFRERLLIAGIGNKAAVRSCMKGWHDLLTPSEGRMYRHCQKQSKYWAIASGFPVSVPLYLINQ